MSKTFNYKSSIKDVQNRLIAASIKDVSNLDLLRSEEAIREVIKSYSDKFRAAEGMLTDVSKYFVESKNLVYLKDFNDLFESFYVDIQALYSDLEAIDRVLTLNLARNKAYYAVVKKRLRDLWQRLRLARMQIYDLTPGDESFYESFYSSVNSSVATDIFVDKKNGYISLAPRLKELKNRSAHIKNILVTTYPVDSEDGGVVHTTSPLNSLTENYKSGPRDMMRNGLWKEEVLCSDVPSMVINIGDATNKIMRAFTGVVSLIDIEYTYPMNINRFDIDVFGDRVLDVDTILYKLKSNDTWSVARIMDEDSLDNSSPLQTNLRQASGRGFDVLSITNILTFKAKYVRLVANQRNYELLDSDRTDSVKLDTIIDQDLGERRYQLIKFGPSLEESLTAPPTDDTKSLLSKILSIIETTRNVADILDKITRVLVPDTSIVTTNFSKTLQFNLGAWSIEPIREEYTTAVGKYDSKPYKFLDGALISASISDNKSIPSSATCNWYISVKGTDIPIVENNARWRKEPVNFIDMSDYGDYSLWPGSFVLLDLPIDASNANLLGIYENGVYNKQFGTKVAFLNSRILYFHDIRDTKRATYVVRYPVSLYGCVTQYVLNASASSQINKDLTLGISCSRREVLKAFCETVQYTSDQASGALKNNFTISSALATIDEARRWHGYAFSTCIWIDDSLYSHLSNIGIFSSLVSWSQSKLSCTVDNAQSYYSGENAIGPADLSVLGTSYVNIAPISTLRSI